MLELAMNRNNEGLFQKEISKNQDISFKYLDQIVAALKRAGLIKTVAGHKSGYKITRPANQISVYDIYKAFESELIIVDCLSNSENCKKDNSCAAKDFWSGLNEHIKSYLISTNLEQLVNKQLEINQNKEEIMFYI